MDEWAKRQLHNERFKKPKEQKDWVFLALKIILDVVLFVWTLALEIVITVLILVATQKQRNDELFGYDRELFEWHPSLAAVGVIILMSNGIIASSAFFFLPVIIVRIYHGLVMIAWFCLGIAAFGIIIRCKVEVDDDHFAEVHERLGLILIFLSAVQLIIGLSKFTLLCCNLKWLGWHGRLGQFIYVVALATVCTGVQLMAEVEPADYDIYYDPANYDAGAAPPPYYTDIKDLDDYSTTIYVLTAALGITILFYDWFLQACGLLPHKLPPLKEKKEDA